MNRPRADSYHHGDLREALLDAGEAVLAEKGFKGFTLRECARRAGVSHAAPKHHFGDATGFLTSIAARGFARLTNRLIERIGDADDLDEEFAATTRTYVGFAEDYPEHFRIMFRCDLLDEQDAGLFRAAHQTFTVLTNVILRQRGDPEILPGDLQANVKFRDVIADILIGWCHIHGFAHLKLEQQLDMVDAADFDALLDETSRRVASVVRAG